MFNNLGTIYLLIAIAADVLSTFYSARANGWQNKTDQIVAFGLYFISFVGAAMALKYMKAGILYVLWAGIGGAATALLAKLFLKQSIDTPGWIGITLIILGVTVIAQWSDLDV